MNKKELFRKAFRAVRANSRGGNGAQFNEPEWCASYYLPQSVAQSVKLELMLSAIKCYHSGVDPLEGGDRRFFRFKQGGVV